MVFPIEYKKVGKHASKNVIWFCPDCGIPMKRERRTHSPTSLCYHSICPKCGLEWCDYYNAYWGTKPKNKNAYVDEPDPWAQEGQYVEEK